MAINTDEEFVASLDEDQRLGLQPVIGIVGKIVDSMWPILTEDQRAYVMRKVATIRDAL